MCVGRYLKAVIDCNFKCTSITFKNLKFLEKMLSTANLTFEIIAGETFKKMKIDKADFKIYEY